MITSFRVWFVWFEVEVEVVTVVVVVKGRREGER